MTKSSISRRSLAGAAAVAAVGLIMPMADANSLTLIELCDEWRSLRQPHRESWAMLIAAMDALPAWAKSGPKYMKNDATLSGPEVGWPMDMTVLPPEYGTYRIVRPSPKDYRQRYEHSKLINIANAKSAYVKGLRRIARLRMAKREEELKLGIPELQRKYDAIVRRIFDLGYAILNLDEHSPDATASKLLMALYFDNEDDMQTNDALGNYEAVLKSLRPHLTGRIATDVGAILDNKQIKLCEQPFWA